MLKSKALLRRHSNSVIAPNTVSTGSGANEVAIVGEAADANWSSTVGRSKRGGESSSSSEEEYEPPAYRLSCRRGVPSTTTTKRVGAVQGPLADEANVKPASSPTPGGAVTLPP